MFVDAVTVTLVAGKGGNGVVAWRREKFIPKGGPAGGNGGHGGSIYLETDQQIPSLEEYRNRRIIKAKNGECGGGNNRTGKSGENLTLKIPCGTLVRDARTKEVLIDAVEDKQKWHICRGGIGGKGNNSFKSPTNQAPIIFTEGTPGESLEIELELKLIADVGLVGIPNAGKSTLLSQLTHLSVKTGAYPFTTLHPNLGFISLEDASRILVADIPGIIENAHLNKGLGLAFLRHIERTSALIYVIDASGFEERDPAKDFRILQDELNAYREGLLDKPFLIALNKADIEGAPEYIEHFYRELPDLKQHCFEISALTGKGIEPFIEAIRTLVIPPVVEAPAEESLLEEEPALVE